MSNRKRKADSLEEERKRHDTKDEDDAYPLQLLIPSAISGAIIGRNGQFVKHLQDRSGAEIQFHRNERADHTRLVIITGSLDQCIRAQKMIITKISEVEID